MSKFVISTEFLTGVDFASSKEYKVKAVILKPKKTEKFYNEDILGTTSLDLVREALDKYTINEAFVESNDSIVEAVEPFMKGCDYIIALFADTPLVTPSIVADAVEYASTKRLDYCKLPRGAVIKSNSSLEYVGEANFLAPHDFLSVFDYKTLSLARSTIKSRIIDQHLKNKVNILDTQTCYIEHDVNIESGVTICANNTIKNGSFVGKNTTLGEGNVIVNSVVEEGSTLFGCYLKNAKIKKNSHLVCEKIWEEKK